MSANGRATYAGTPLCRLLDRGRLPHLRALRQAFPVQPRRLQSVRHGVRGRAEHARLGPERRSARSRSGSDARSLPWWKRQGAASGDRRRRRTILLAVALAVAILVAALHKTPVWSLLESRAFDYFSTTAAPGRPEDGPIIVAIDEPSLAEIGLQWPWPRSLHARLVEALRKAGRQGDRARHHLRRAVERGGGRGAGGRPRPRRGAGGRRDPHRDRPGRPARSGSSRCRASPMRGARVGIASIIARPRRHPAAPAVLSRRLRRRARWRPPAQPARPPDGALLQTFGRRAPIRPSPTIRRSIRTLSCRPGFSATASCWSASACRTRRRVRRRRRRRSCHLLRPSAPGGWCPASRSRRRSSTIWRTACPSRAPRTPVSLLSIVLGGAIRLPGRLAAHGLADDRGRRRLASSACSRRATRPCASAASSWRRSPGARLRRWSPASAARSTSPPSAGCAAPSRGPSRTISSPALVERLARDPSQLQLGGERAHAVDPVLRHPRLHRPSPRG